MGYPSMTKHLVHAQQIHKKQRNRASIAILHLTVRPSTLNRKKAKKNIVCAIHQSSYDNVETLYNNQTRIKDAFELFFQVSHTVNF